MGAFFKLADIHKPAPPLFDPPKHSVEFGFSERFMFKVSNARDGKLDKSEMSIFLIRSWLADDGALVKSEIEKSHAMLAKHLMLDMQRMDIPSLDGQDTVLETLDDGREVIMLGSTTLAGSIVSRPGQAAALASWGNSVKYPEKNLETIRAIHKATKKR